MVGNHINSNISSLLTGLLEKGTNTATLETMALDEIMANINKQLVLN